MPQRATPVSLGSGGRSGLLQAKGEPQSHSARSQRPWPRRLAAPTSPDSAPVNAQVCRVAGAGHNVPLDNPLGVVDAILASAKPGALDGRLFGQEALHQDAAWRATLQTS